MIIAQISDLHITTNGERDDNISRLEQVVDYIANLSLKPDLLVASGDMTEDAAPASYRLVRALLSPLDMPILFAMGNHDRRDTFRAVFPDTPVTDGFVQYALELGERRIVVLDTLEEGDEGGGFCARRAGWLAETLSARPETETLIVLHHPPACIGIDWMDIHPRDGWTERLAAVVRPHGQVIGLIAGHVHRPTATMWEGRMLTTVSSTAAQVALDLMPIDPDRPDGRALIVNEPPSLALHRWTQHGITTHFDQADQPEIVVAFDEEHRGMIEQLMRPGPRP